MAIVTEVFRGDGTTKNFALGFPIISESHIAVHINKNPSNVYGEEILDRSNWNVLSNSVILNTAPSAGEVILISQATDGKYSCTTPTECSRLAQVAQEIKNLSPASESIIIVSNNTGNMQTVVDNIDNLNAIVSNIDKINIVSFDISDVNYIAKVWLGGLNYFPANRRDGSVLETGDLFYHKGAEHKCVYVRDVEDNTWVKVGKGKDGKDGLNGKDSCGGGGSVTKEAVGELFGAGEIGDVITKNGTNPQDFGYAPLPKASATVFGIAKMWVDGTTLFIRTTE